VQQSHTSNRYSYYYAFTSDIEWCWVFACRDVSDCISA